MAQTPPIVVQLIKGDKGDRGIKGDPGPVGDTGPQGLQGVAGSVTGGIASVSGTSPIFSSGGSTPTITIQGSIVSGSTSTTAQNLGSLTTGILLGTVSGGINVLSTLIVGSGLSLTGSTLSATGGGGGVSSVTATAPAFSSGGSTPNITIQGALKTGSTSTTAQNLGSLTTGILLGTVSGGINTLSTLTVGSGLTLSGSTLTATNAGTVTSVTGSAPIASSGGATPNITIAASSQSVTGSFASADKVKLDQGYKAGCVVVYTTNITGTGSIPTDGVTPANGARVLVAGQTTKSQNGIFIVNTGGSWSRATDFTASTDATAGTLIPIYSGNAYTGSVWQLTTTGALTIGTTPLTFSWITLVDPAVALASVRLNVTPSALSWDFNEWGLNSGFSAVAGVTWTKSAGTGAGASTKNSDNPAALTLKGGILNVWTGTTASTAADLTSAGNYLPLLGGTDPSYISFRVKFSAVGTSPVIACGMYDTVINSVTIGIFSAHSTSQIALQYNGKWDNTNTPQYLNLIAADTAWHTYEIWTVGDGKIHVAVDGTENGSSPVTPTTPIPNQPFIFFHAGIGAGGDANTYLLNDWVFVATTAV